VPPRPRQPLLILLAALLPVLLATGIWLGAHPDNLPEPVRDALVGDNEAQAIDAAIDEVAGEFYREVDRDRLVDSALSGMVRSLRDDFSAYFSPNQYRRYQEATDAQFSGVGMGVREDRRGLRVVQVYDDSPADRADIRTGDVITGANGTSLAGKPEEVSTSLIRGRPGTRVRLTIISRGRRRTVNVERATVSVPVVASRLRRAGGERVAHVALAQFSSGAHGEVRQAIERRLRQGAKGVVFDLRGNGGGLLEEARLVSSIFLAEGPIVSTRGRSQPTRTLMASGGAIDEDVPVVVLVDGDSASASEIVTGALQDRGRAKVVGSKTFGKGVFQEVTTLPNGGALDITVGRYFTPKGRNLGGNGIRPDVEARDDRDTARRDEALLAAERVLARSL
jgi:carboxyl-terminal processing protease